MSNEGVEGGHGPGRRPSLSVIVQVEPADPQLPAYLREVRAAAAAVNGQVIASCREPWPDAPLDIDVVVANSGGKADCYDRAAQHAVGDLVAFLDRHVTPSPEWATKAQQAFDGSDVMIVGGPVIPQGSRTGERVGALVMTHYLRATPAAHNARMAKRREVREVGWSNLVVRADAFRAVGGFQTPIGEGSASVRLCYKVRSLLNGKVISDPGLALSAPAPRFPGPLLRDVADYGKSRGNLAHRLPEVAPLLPYAIPSLVLVIFVAAASIALGIGAVWLALLVAAAIYLAAAMAPLTLGLRAPGGPFDRLMACFALPIVLTVFGLTFARGYFGGSSEISPPRERESPLRVLILNWRDVTHPWTGGAETYMHEIARRWAAAGMDVAWLTQRHTGSPRHQVIDRIHFYRVGGRLTLYPRAALTYLLRLRGRYDVIVDCENGVPFFSPLYSRLPTVLVVHHVHQEIFRTQLPPLLRWFALWLEGSFMPRVYRGTQVVAVSEGTRTDLIGLGFDPARVTIVTNGVVPPQETSVPRSPHPTILHMGRLKPQKSVDVLIRSLPRIVSRVPGLHVDIVGQGPDRHRLERLAWLTGMAGCVRFHGYVTSRVRDEIAASAWVAACPSSFEGWGVVCMEASARGLPVVASNVSGLRESVRDGVTGLLVPHGDEVALADAIVSLLQDPEKRLAMGSEGVEWAARHTWDESASKFAALVADQIGMEKTDGEKRPALATATGQWFGW